MRRGDAFVNVNEGSYPHLWIICLEFDDGSVLMFNLTSLENAADATCIVRPGEHPWVIKDSAIDYERARILDARKIAFLRGLNVMEQQVAASEALIQKILAGALLSKETARTYKAMIELALQGGTNEG